jgi:hypothetical protein
MKKGLGVDGGLQGLALHKGDVSTTLDMTEGESVGMIVWVDVRYLSP